MDYITVFWTVLVLLLAAGFLYYLLQALQSHWEQKHQAQLGSLYRLAEEAVGPSDLGLVAGRIAAILHQITDGTHGAVWAYDPASQQLKYQAGTEEPPAVSLSLDTMSGVVTCFRNEAVTEVADAENCPFVSQESVRRLGQKSLLYVPIMAGGACAGVIEVEDRRRKRVFPLEQKARLQHVARLAALTLRQRQQTSLREELQRYEKWAVLKELADSVEQRLARPLGKILALSEDPAETDHPALLVGRLKAIDEQAREASERLTRLLEFTRAGSFEATDFTELLGVVASRFKHNWKPKGLDLSINLSRTPAIIHADAPQLEEINRQHLSPCRRLC